MKTILFVIDNLGKGGAQSITVSLANYLASMQNIHVKLAILNNKNQECFVNDLVQVVDLKINVIFSNGKLWKSKKLSIDEIVRVNDVLNYQSYDLIVLGFHNGYYLYDYLWEKDKIYFWMHGAVLEKRPANFFIKKIQQNLRFLKHKNKFKKIFNNKNIIAVSSDLKMKYERILPTANFNIIPNGINLQKFSTSDRTEEKKWDILFVGRLVKIKQVDHAIKAYALSNLTGKLGILGEGPEQSALEGLVNRLGIRDRVDFLGWSNHPNEIIKQANAVCLCSSSEGSPISLLEALANNIPIISYDSSSSISLLFDNEVMRSYLIPKNDISALADGFNRIIHSSSPIPLKVKKLIDIDTMANSFLDLIS